MGQKAAIEREGAQVIDALKPGGAARTVGMNFAAEDENFDRAIGVTVRVVEPIKDRRGVLKFEHGRIAIGAKVTVRAAIEAFVGWDDRIGRAIGNVAIGVGQGLLKGSLRRIGRVGAVFGFDR